MRWLPRLALAGFLYAGCTAARNATPGGAHDSCLSSLDTLTVYMLREPEREYLAGYLNSLQKLRQRFPMPRELPLPGHDSLVVLVPPIDASGDSLLLSFLQEGGDKPFYVTKQDSSYVFVGCDDGKKLTVKMPGCPAFDEAYRRAKESYSLE